MDVIYSSVGVLYGDYVNCHPRGAAVQYDFEAELRGEMDEDKALIKYVESADLRLLCQALKWSAWIAGLLLVAGITGLIALYGQVQGLQHDIADMKASVERIYHIVEPRYRGGDNADSP